ncbi:MAG: Hsp70 family protein [Ignavibacteria bacterium]|nr:Hsp70 family protein [Ignavibacteria bacterium]MBK6419363.1 Hsp70 family protein [Ignavibacteria bacterium]MBK6760006.1 Hsp70 family protein [Ignavibacteria bacterium]MBK7032797.1 Hsp70 family protein [Ignavibacteria bacterium]MBK7184894.1 Hsp70 family protein [Ignavibacteria bacterium]
MSHLAIGIDLGTTFSAVATINPAGRPEIVANADGDRITASAVTFLENGSVVVGNQAVDASTDAPDRTVRWVKRNIGQADWNVVIDGRAYSAVDISGMILDRVRRDAEQVLGPIMSAVVTVPAYFDEFRRKATMDAASAASLDVLRIINEPTAAALAYNTSGKINGNVLVYDLGGGTFDVSVIRADSPDSMTVISSEGDHQLGGVDFDKVLAEMFNESFIEQHGMPLIHSGNSSVDNAVMLEAERVKRKLTQMSIVQNITLRSGDLFSTTSVDRATFNERIRPLLIRTEMLIDDALDHASLRARDITAVVLVGGSTRVPAVHDLLRTKFGQEPLRHINPDEAVALGAAVQAGIILQERGVMMPVTEEAKMALSKVSLTDVTNHSYGTITMGHAHGRETLRNSLIIPKNTPIPCTHSDTFFTIHDDQQVIHCTITQGEDLDPEFVNVITEGFMKLPAGRPRGCEILITYSYDANGRMSCEFKDVLTGRIQCFNLDSLPTS